MNNTDHVDYYVYHLKDPISNLTFYVGKGRLNRIYDHERSVTIGKIPNNNKYLFYKIKKILRLNVKIIYVKIKENLNQIEAYKLEREEIIKYGRKNNKTGILCNMSDGGSGPNGFIMKEKTKKHLSDCTKKYLLDNPDKLNVRVNNLLKYSKIGSDLAADINSKVYSFYTPNNKLINVKNLSKFCRENGLRRSRLFRVIRGERNMYKGYKNVSYVDGGCERKSNSYKLKLLYNSPEWKRRWSDIHRKRCADPNYKNPTAKHCKLLSPSGEIVEIFNMSHFCKDNNLSIGHLSSVVNGNRPHHKGWRIYK